MAKNWYVGASAVAHKVKKMYVGVGGVAHKAKKVYIGDANGKARLCWSGEDKIVYVYYLPRSSGSGDLVCKDENRELIKQVRVAFGTTTGDRSLEGMYDAVSKLFVFCPRVGTNYIGYWDGESDAATLTSYTSKGGSHRRYLNNRYLYTTYSDGSKYVIGRTDLRNGTESIMQNVGGYDYTPLDFGTYNYSKFFVLNQGNQVGVPTGTNTLTLIYQFPTPRYDSQVNYALCVGNKFICYRGAESGTSQINMCIVDMTNNTYITPKVNVGYSLNVNLLGSFKNRIYFSTPPDSVYTSNNEVWYISMPTSSTTLTRTIVIPSHANVSGYGSYIKGGNKFLVLNIWNNGTYRTSKDGTNFTSNESGRGLITNDVT